MNTRLIKTACACALIIAGLFQAAPVRAQSGVSDFPIYSVISVAVVVYSAGAVSTAVLAAPVVLSSAGAVFVVRAVEVSATGTVYILERTSDGVRVSLQVAGKAAKGAAQAIGTTAAISVIAAGVVVSLAGEVIAFVPNVIGQALLHNERIVY
jgi:hypothetical protein